MIPLDPVRRGHARHRHPLQARRQPAARQPPAEPQLQYEDRRRASATLGSSSPAGSTVTTPTSGSSTTSSSPARTAATAYEGRVEATPRDLSDRHSIGVTLAGWMAHAKDRKFAMPFVDRPTGTVGQVPVERRAASPRRASAPATSASRRTAAAHRRAAQPGARRADRRRNVVRGAAGTTIAGVAYRGTSTSLPAGYVAGTAATPASGARPSASRSSPRTATTG
jgi:hypothetical protein